jgi:hypothetical protein
MRSIESSGLSRRTLIAAGIAACTSIGAGRAPSWPGFELAGRRALPAPAGCAVTEFNLRRTTGADTPVQLVWTQGEAAASGLRILPVERRGAPQPLYRAVALPPNTLAAINGSFFEGRPGAPDERPMGLLRIAGQTRYPTSHRRGGGFLIADDRPVRIVDRGHAAIAEAARWAVESSPVLIYRGANGMRRDDGVRYDRVAAGVSVSGRPLLLGAFGRGQDCVSLYEFEQLARAAASAHGEAIADLIAMDGGPSAHLLLPGGRLYGATSSIYLTNLIALTA